MPTLKELRRAVADRVAPFELATTGVEGPSGGYVGRALGGSRRRLVSTDLVSVDALGSGPENPGDYLKNEWVYLLTSPPQQRRVPEGGFVGYARADEVADHYPGDPAQEVAYLDVERPFLTVVDASTELEIHAIPPQRGGKSAGLHRHIQHALRVILREDTVTVEAVSGQSRIDVTAALPWLTAVGQFVGATYAETVAGVDTYAIPGARLRFDADRALVSPIAAASSAGGTGTASGGTGQEIPLRVLRPLSTWIKPYGGDWGESTAGLVDEDDECVGDADAISLVAAFHVAEEQAHACVVGSREQLWWQAKAAAFASRSVFLRDQRTLKPRYAGSEWPDFIAIEGRYSGRWGPGFR